MKIVYIIVIFYSYKLLGYLARFRPLSTNGAFTASLTFKPITLPQIGEYKISFYSFIYCPKADCDTNDYIALFIKENNNDFREIYRIGTQLGRVRDLQWNKEIINLRISSTDIIVKIFFIIKPFLTKINIKKNKKLFIDKI